MRRSSFDNAWSYCSSLSEKGTKTYRFYCGYHLFCESSNRFGLLYTVFRASRCGQCLHANGATYSSQIGFITQFKPLVYIIPKSSAPRGRHRTPSSFCVGGFEVSLRVLLDEIRILSSFPSKANPIRFCPSWSACLLLLDPLERRPGLNFPSGIFKCVCALFPL